MWAGYDHQIHLTEADLCFYNGGAADEKCYF